MEELEAFAVKTGQESKANEWMQFLKDHQRAVDQTLAPEGLKREQIWSVEFAGRLYLCWYSNQDRPATRRVETSNDPIDQQRVAYWEACIDETVPSIKFNLRNSFTRFDG